MILLRMVLWLNLCLDSSHIAVLEAALRIYPGRALINSISLESEKFEKLIPIAKKYGAMCILLPLSDEGLPKSLEEKKEIIQAHGENINCISTEGVGTEFIFTLPIAKDKE